MRAPKNKTKPRKIGGMTVDELKPEDFRPIPRAKLGESLRKSAVKKRK